MFMLMLKIVYVDAQKLLYVVDGLRAVVVCVCDGLRAVVCIYVVAAIVSFVYCRVWKPHGVGEVLPNFLTDTTMFLLFSERSPADLSRSTSVIPLPRRCGPATQGITHISVSCSSIA
jgi:hypothetical protein